jgi:hypothetical protein
VSPERPVPREGATQGRPGAGTAKRLFTEAYDAAAAGFARSADRLVYAYLARPLARALAEADGPVLDVAAGPGEADQLGQEPAVATSR